MAAGDILAVEIGADGWWADVTIEGLSTAGIYDFGLGALNSPAAGAPRLVLTVTSLGYTTTGTPTTVTRTVYGTTAVRRPYPNEAQKQETASAGNVTVRVALSDYVYAKDKTGGGNSGTDVTVTLLSGLYTQGGTPSVAATLTATNSSTAAYPKVVANWSWPDGLKVASAVDLKAVAFHQSADSGRPVQCVVFSVADQSAHVVSQTVAVPAIDGTLGDAEPVIEYTASLSTSTLTQGEVLTANFVAYPRVGDSGAVLDTSTGTSGATPLVGPRVYLCDKAGTYGASYATVDPVGGNDGTGAVVATGLPTLPYATIAAAYNGLRTYNNATYSRNNCGGSTIYLADGSHAYLGGTVTVGTAPSTWLTITKHPSATGPVIATSTGGKSAGLMVRVTDVTISAQSATGTFSAGPNSRLWVDRCTINCPTASQPPIYINQVWHVTRCQVTALNMNFRPFATVNAAPGVIRGNIITDTSGNGAIVYTFLGNRKTGTGAGYGMQDTYTGMTIPSAVGVIIAYNWMSGSTSARPMVGMRGAFNDSAGIALVQNVFEQTANTPQTLVQLAADSTINTPSDNAIVWHNTIVGQRANLAYNEVDPGAGGGLAYRRYWSIVGNVLDDWNIKSDTFAGSGFVADGSKVGNWPVVYGVGCSGNLDVEAVGIGAPGNFVFEFAGIDTDQPTPSPTVHPPTSATRSPSYPQFTARASWDGTSAGAGGGTYTLAAGSPAAGLAARLVLPYDLAGVQRRAGGAAGAYEIPATTALLAATALLGV